MSDLYELIEESTICSVVKNDGGFLVAGAVFIKQVDDEGNTYYIKKHKLHTCTSHQEVAKKVKFYCQENLAAENGELG